MTRAHEHQNIERLHTTAATIGASAITTDWPPNTPTTLYALSKSTAQPNNVRKCCGFPLKSLKTILGTW